ncbi:glycosyltransferase family 2 protein [Marinicauda algicola]|uniref:Glycosyltransferase family 2 protein n=1 Tax=Marinicauda algicola TaxID=2029849 RepID=A0A4S2H440_9PROT|nr:glycosyltransferase family 2 protein [Marinicauda algicola]TGY90293.1 glycosyltransferase family 2 protein [Marinicauda algicola]
MPSRPKIAVIIIAYNSRAQIGACLTALRVQTRAPAEIILVENGSAPDKRVDPDDLGPDITYIDSPDNLGFAGANNLAARRARSPWIALLNPDAFAEPDWIEALEAAIARYPTDRVFGSLQYSADDPGKLDGAGDVYHAIGFPWRGGYGAPVEDAPQADATVFSACGAAMLIERDLFLALGGFDEAFFCYCEDVDLGYKARLAGERVIQLAGARVRHVGSASSEGSWHFAFHHGVRNRLWTYLQNTPLALLLLTAPLHAAATGVQLLSAVRRGRGRAFLAALNDGLSDWNRVMAVRRERQRARVASTLRIASAMSWSPVVLVRGAMDLRRLPIDLASGAPDEAV